MNAMCPHCNDTITNIRIETPPAYNLNGKQFPGAVFLCPSCNAVLGAGIDQAAVATDLADDVVRRVTSLLKQ